MLPSDIEVLETFLLSNEDRTWTAQPWIYGCPLFMWTFTDEQRELLSDTLAALSHFIYEQNNGYLVHTDFQGIDVRFIHPSIFLLIWCLHFSVDKPGGALHLRRKITQEVCNIFLSMSS